MSIGMKEWSAQKIVKGDGGEKMSYDNKETHNEYVAKLKPLCNDTDKCMLQLEK